MSFCYGVRPYSYLLLHSYINCRDKYYQFSLPFLQVVVILFNTILLNFLIIRRYSYLLDVRISYRTYFGLGLVIHKGLGKF